MRRCSLEPHRLEDVLGGDRVLLQIPPRVLGSEPHVGVGREVEHELLTGHGVGQPLPVEQVPLGEPEAGLVPGSCEEFALPSREVVIDRDTVAVGQKTIHEVTADEACASADKCVHVGMVTRRGR